MEKLIAQIDANTAWSWCISGFLRRVIDYKPLIEAAHNAGALVAVAVNPTALGVLTPPGEFGADIVFGEGHTLGIPLSYAVHIWHLRGNERLAAKNFRPALGETVDNAGRLAYVLTLTAASSTSAARKPPLISARTRFNGAGFHHLPEFASGSRASKPSATCASKKRITPPNKSALSRLYPGIFKPALLSRIRHPPAHSRWNTCLKTCALTTSSGLRPCKDYPELKAAC